MQKGFIFKSILYLFLTVFVLFFFFPDNKIASAEYRVSRLAGLDRYETAVQISEEGWDTSKYAIIVRGDNFADALCAGPLAKKYNCPILFSDLDLDNDSTIDELDRLETENVLIVGGYGAISRTAEKVLYSLGINNIERIYGSDRYETSVEIAKRLGSKDIALTTGNDYSDALSISSIAGAKGFAILLTPPNNLPESVKKHLNNYKIEHTYIIGGTGAINKSIESQVPSPTRISGKNRYETNKLILQKFSADLDFNNIFVSRGEGEDGFADSLSGGVLAAQYGSPIILVNSQLPEVTRDYLKTKLTVAGHIIALGGSGAVSDDVVETLLYDLSNIKKSVFDQPGTYGPLTGTSTVAGNIDIETGDITVQNTVIEGDLLLGEGIYNGDVTLKNVTVKGQITIRSGYNSLLLGDALIAKNVTIDVPNNRVIDFMVKNKSKIDKVKILSPAQLDDSEEATSGGFNDVSVQLGDATLLGTFNNINVSASGSDIILDTADIKALNAMSPENVSGDGKIAKATISSNGVVIDIKPASTVVLSGYEALVDGDWLTGPIPVK